MCASNTVKNLPLDWKCALMHSWKGSVGTMRSNSLDWPLIKNLQAICLTHLLRCGMTTGRFILWGNLSSFPWHCSYLACRNIATWGIYFYKIRRKSITLQKDVPGCDCVKMCSSLFRTLELLKGWVRGLCNTEVVGGIHEEEPPSFHKEVRDWRNSSHILFWLVIHFAF